MSTLSRVSECAEKPLHVLVHVDLLPVTHDFHHHHVSARVSSRFDD